MPFVTSVERLATQKGLHQGLQQGRVEGKLEGKTEKAATILERLLVKGFGPLDEETRKRLGTATLEQLDLWADRILDAATIDAVFEGH